MTYTLTIAPGTADERVFGADDLDDVDFARTHTGVGNFQVVVPFAPDLEDLLFAEVFLERGSEFLFRGRLETVETTESSAETRLSGRGKAVDLRDGAATVTYETIRAHRAIWDYWARYWWPTEITDGFEDGDVSEWAGDTGFFGATQDNPREGSFDGELDTGGASDRAVVYRTGSTQDGGTGAELYAAVPTSDTVEVALREADRGPRAARLRANSGTWEYYDGSTWVDGGVAVAGADEYQRLEVLADEDEEVFAAYVGGLTVGREVPFAESASDLRLTLETDPDNVARVDTIAVTGENVDVLPPSSLGGVDDEAAYDVPDADTFADVLSIAETTPAFIDGAGSLRVAQTSRFEEGETAGSDFSGTRSDSEYSDGEAAVLVDLADDLTATFDLDYRIPGDNVEMAVRVDARNGHNGFDMIVEGETLTSLGPDTLSAELDWYDTFGGISSDLTPGSNTFKINCTGTSGGDDLVVDGLALYDSRYRPDLTETITNGYLDGPQDYPESVPLETDEERTPWDVTAGESAVVMAESDETPNRLQLRLSGQTYRPDDGSEKNTTSVATTFGSEVGSTLQGRLDIGRRDDTRDTATPRTGFEGHVVEEYELRYDGSDTAVIEQKTFEGDHLRNLIRLHEFASMRFSLEHAAASRGATSFRIGDAVRPDLDVTITDRARKVSGRGYANDVTVRGRTDEVTGERPTRTIRDEAEVQRVGRVVHEDITDPSLRTEEDVVSTARSELGDRTVQADPRGRLNIVPEDVRPGFTYPVTWWDGTTDDVPLEEVSYQERRGELRGLLRLDINPSLVDAVARLRGNTDRNTDAL